MRDWNIESIGLARARAFSESKKDINRIIHDVS
jgi:hypothetical protein